MTDFATFAFTRLNTGGTLFDLVRANRSGLEPRLARRYAAQLAEAMRYLHEDVRVVHRDLKLENCLIDLANPDTVALGGDLLLCDFGLAEFFSSDGGSGGGGGGVHDGDGDGDGMREGSLSASADLASRIGPSETSTSIAGSLQYAAPELILSPVGLLSTAVDMWAFGVVCFALVVGDLPFQHMFQPRVQLMILAGEWERGALRRGKGARGWVAEVEEVVRGCLEMEVGRRWDVRRCLGSRWLRGVEGVGEEVSGWGGGGR